jgi:hypothetical protein
MDDLPVINITIGDNTYKAVSYSWDGNDFYFTTENDESFCYKNMYPANLKFEGLDYDDSDIVELHGMYSKHW